jgi:hypothetical protein
MVRTLIASAASTAGRYGRGADTRGHRSPTAYLVELWRAERLRPKA